MNTARVNNGINIPTMLVQAAVGAIGAAALWLLSGISSDLDSLGRKVDDVQDSLYQVSARVLVLEDRKERAE